MTGFFVEGIATLFDAILMVLFLTFYHGPKWKGKKQIGAEVCAVMMIFISEVLFDQRIVFSALILIPIFIISFLYATVALCEAWELKILSCILFLTGWAFINSSVAILFDLIYFGDLKAVVTSQGIYRVMMLLTMKIICLGYAVFLYRIKPVHAEQIDRKTWRAIYFIPILSIFILSLFIRIALQFPLGSREKAYLLFVIAGALFINICAYYLFYHAGKEYEMKRKNDLLEQKLLRWQESQKMYDEVQKIKHDYKNEMYGLCRLIEAGEAQKAAYLIRKKIGKVEALEKFIFSDNNIFDAVANQKYKDAKRQGVKFTYGISCSLKNRLDDLDFASLIGNLLDNAIRAASQSKAKCVQMKMGEVNGYFIILVSNSIDESVLKNNPMLKTTMTDQKNHGYGLQRVKEIVKKADGHIEFKEEEEYFIVRIWI